MSDHISGPRAMAEPIADITDEQGALAIVASIVDLARDGHLYLAGSAGSGRTVAGRAARPTISGSRG